MIFAKINKYKSSCYRQPLNLRQHLNRIDWVGCVHTITYHRKKATSKEILIYFLSCYLEFKGKFQIT